jgi:carbonic anhydrase/acetyltransferase-like protein (isoleucine patch superfamily)
MRNRERRLFAVTAMMVLAGSVRLVAQGRPNVVTDFNPDVESPVVAATAYVDPQASLIGNVAIGSRVYVAPFASVRGDEGQPIHIGDESNVQDGVVLHALETPPRAKPRTRTPISSMESGTRCTSGTGYPWLTSRRCTDRRGSKMTCFAGMKALVFKAHIGKGCVIE